jgi:hypothetical protein
LDARGFSSEVWAMIWIIYALVTIGLIYWFVKPEEW